MSTEHFPVRVAVIGAGTMGSGIALSFARVGSEVRLAARRESTLDRARERIAQSVAWLGAKGLLGHVSRDHVEARITTTTSLENAVRDVELVIESIPEDAPAKRDVLRRAEKAAPAFALLCTDTSSLSIAELAAALNRPEKFAGFHWFNPPELVELVEIVSGPETEPETVERLLGWAKTVGKRPIHVQRDIEGFIANRLQYALLREAFALVEGGFCEYGEVDEAVKAGLGPRWTAVGPFESMDLAGLDVHHEVARRLYPTLSTDAEPAASVSRLVADGSLGCKSGRGLYGVYEEERVRRMTRRRDMMLAALTEIRSDGAPS